MKTLSEAMAVVLTITVTFDCPGEDKARSAEATQSKRDDAEQWNGSKKRSCEE
tara:strand:+ start:104 stop:262 length:159 start_codon:yes stop_codon:yes gene_type:complete